MTEARQMGRRLSNGPCGEARATPQAALRFLPASPRGLRPARSDLNPSVPAPSFVSPSYTECILNCPVKLSCCSICVRSEICACFVAVKKEQSGIDLEMYYLVVDSVLTEVRRESGSYDIRVLALWSQCSRCIAAESWRRRHAPAGWERGATRNEARSPSARSCTINYQINI